MRIGIEIKHLDETRGGAEAHTCRFARWLVDSGHEVHLFARDIVSTLEGVVVHHVNPFSPVTLGEAAGRAHLDLFVGTDQAVAMDVFHPHRGSVRGNMNRVVERIGSPFLRNVAELANVINPRLHRNLALERRQLAGTGGPAVIAVSEMVARELRNEIPISPERLHIVRNGVDCSWFSVEDCRERRPAARRQLGLQDEAVCFLTVANDFARKGITSLIKATSIVARQHRLVRTVVVGREDDGRYKRMAARTCGHGIFSFVPLMKDIRTAYAAADVFVLPTWYDPCSLTLMEAMACGLPVISTLRNGACEIVVDGHEGFVIDSPAHVNELANRMNLLMQVERRTSMGQHARILAGKHLQENNFSRLAELFHRRLAGRRLGSDFV